MSTLLDSYLATDVDIDGIPVGVTTGGAFILLAQPNLTAATISNLGTEYRAYLAAKAAKAAIARRAAAPALTGDATGNFYAWTFRGVTPLLAVRGRHATTGRILVTYLSGAKGSLGPYESVFRLAEKERDQADALLAELDGLNERLHALTDEHRIEGTPYLSIPQGFPPEIRTVERRSREEISRTPVRVLPGGLLYVTLQGEEISAPSAHTLAQTVNARLHPDYGKPVYVTNGNFDLLAEGPYQGDKDLHRIEGEHIYVYRKTAPLGVLRRIDTRSEEIRKEVRDMQADHLVEIPRNAR